MSTDLTIFVQLDIFGLFGIWDNFGICGQFFFAGNSCDGQLFGLTGFVLRTRLAMRTILCSFIYIGQL